AGSAGLKNQIIPTFLNPCSAADLGKGQGPQNTKAKISTPKCRLTFARPTKPTKKRSVSTERTSASPFPQESPTGNKSNSRVTAETAQTADPTVTYTLNLQF